MRPVQTFSCASAQSQGGQKLGLDPGKKIGGPHGQCHYHRAWSLAAAAAPTGAGLPAAPSACGAQARVLGAQGVPGVPGRGAAPQLPTPPPPFPQDEEAAGLPVCLLGQAQPRKLPRGTKGGGRSERVDRDISKSRAKLAGCRPAAQALMKGEEEGGEEGESGRWEAAPQIKLSSPAGPLQSPGPRSFVHASHQPCPTPTLSFRKIPSSCKAEGERCKNSQKFSQGFCVNLFFPENDCICFAGLTELKQPENSQM